MTNLDPSADRRGRNNDGVSPVLVWRGLRAWAAGYPTDEAAVELLWLLEQDNASTGQLVDGGLSVWVRPCRRPGLFWLDGDRLIRRLDLFPPQVRPVVVVAAALVSGGPVQTLGATFTATPARYLGAVLGALAHVATNLPETTLVRADAASLHDTGDVAFSWSPPVERLEIA